MGVFSINGLRPVLRVAIFKGMEATPAAALSMAVSLIAAKLGLDVSAAEVSALIKLAQIAK